MKKLIALFLAVMMIVSLAACGGKTIASGTTSVNEEKQTTSAEEEKTGAPETAASADGVDIDLTAMSGTMVYSEVLNMQKTPEAYEGKVVKMSGPFNVTDYNGKKYFACIIADATACCSTGIEFDLKGDYSYPEDYPAPQTEITVVGVFNTYMEGKSRYLQLKDAEIVA